ncbi:hypothetical protein LXA43DRAFT_850933, partial [Ganoderma leucocontextum]
SAVSVPWDARNYAKALPKKTTLSEDVENELLLRFPPIIEPRSVIGRAEPLPVVRDPAVFIDKDGQILVWSLP